MEELSYADFLANAEILIPLAATGIEYVKIILPNGSAAVLVGEKIWNICALATGICLPDDMV